MKETAPPETATKTAVIKKSSNHRSVDPPETEVSNSGKTHLHNGGGEKRLDKSAPPPMAFDYGRRNLAKATGVSSKNDWPAPLETTRSEVSSGQCSDLVRYDPKKARKVSKIYSEWSSKQEMILRPPIVFNGTFPIDKPISSRFFGIETIDEERSSDQEVTSSSSSSASDGGVRNRRNRDHVKGFRDSKILRRPTVDVHHKVRFRRRSRSRPKLE